MKPEMKIKKERRPQAAPNRWAQRIVPVLFPLIIIGAGIWGYTIIKNPEVKPKRRPPAAMVSQVTIQTVYPQDHDAVISALGTVVPARELIVKARVSGEVIRIHPRFIPGGRLAKGVELLRIDPADYHSVVTLRERAVTETEYRLKLEESSRDVAQKEWELLKKDGPLPGDLDSELALREPQIKKARADLNAAKAELAQARRNLGRTLVRVPFNALVLEKHVEVGSSITVNEALATLVGTDEYWVEATVPLNRLDRIAIPASANENGPLATIIYRDRYTVPGRVIKLLSDMGEKGQMARVLISIADPLGDSTPQASPQPVLLINEFVQVKIAGRPLTAVYKIPRTAMRENRQVWLADEENRLIIQPVRIAWQDDKGFYVTEGLSPGDRLINSAIATPVANMQLRVVADSKETAPPSKQPEITDEAAVKES